MSLIRWSLLIPIVFCFTPSSSGDIELPYFRTEISSSSSPYAIALAKHLNSIGAKMYGAFWCSHCLEQKEVVSSFITCLPRISFMLLLYVHYSSIHLQMFGREAAKELNYVECFPDGYKKGTKILKACADAAIEGFPTWIINDKVSKSSEPLVHFITCQYLFHLFYKLGLKRRNRTR